MKDFPRWMLALAFTCLVPILICPLYLFGGLHLFGTTNYTLVNFLLYLLQNLLWVVPIGAFFLSLDLYRRGFERMGVAIAILGIVLAALSIAVVL